MRSLVIALAPLLALAACHASVERTERDPQDKSVHIAMDQGGDRDQVSMNIPGLDAKVALPMIDLGRHVDLDGIKLAPDTHVSAIDVTAKDTDEGNKGDGRVRLSFASPQTPAALIDYYRRSATQAGYGNVTASTDVLTANKQDKAFALAVAADGKGSRGTITVGRKDS